MSTESMYPKMVKSEAPPSPDKSSAAAPGDPPAVQGPAGDQVDRAESLRTLYSSLEKPPDEWNPVRADDSAAEGLFPPGGSPPSPGTNYAPAIDQLFEHEEKEARYNQAPDEFHTELATNRAGLETAFQNLEIGMAGAREMTLLARQFVDFPPDEAAREATMAGTMSSLKEDYGDDLGKVLAGAQRVIAEASKTTPELIPFMNRSGMGNHPRLVRMAIAIAKRKGW